MEHWSPEDTRTAQEQPAPQDAWVTWLTRAPLHEVTPDSPRVRDWAGAAMLSCVALFWAAAGGLAWHALT